MGFPDNLKKIRKQKGFTQEKLASSLNVVQRCIANWETGLRQPKVSELILIAKKLGVSISALTGFRIPHSLSFYTNTTTSTKDMPLYASHVSAGFPSPADDYIEKRLNLNDLVIKNPTSTFFVKAHGNSMIGAGINDGDILVVDKSKNPANNSVVIAVLNGELAVKRIHKDKRKLVLVPENDEFENIEVTGDMEFIVWGVVTNVVHPL
jgi:DNA polymerase V